MQGCAETHLHVDGFCLQQWSSSRVLVIMRSCTCLKVWMKGVVSSDKLNWCLSENITPSNMSPAVYGALFSYLKAMINQYPHHLHLHIHLAPCTQPAMAQPSGPFILVRNFCFSSHLTEPSSSSNIHMCQSAGSKWVCIFCVCLHGHA